MRFAFRRLVDEDLPRLHGWLNDPAVVRWWEGDDVSWDGVVQDYSEATRGPEGHHLALLDDRPVGWIQWWADDDRDEWVALGADPSVVGIDYLLGEAADRGRGVGSAMVRAFVDDVVVPAHPGCRQVGADPAVANAASWGALAKAGFRPLADLPGPEGLHRLMVLDLP